MRIPTRLACATALLAGAFPALSPAPLPAPAGPGGVAIAIRDFLTAVDRGEADAAAFDRSFGVTVGADLRAIPAEEAPPLFTDVGADGTRIEARDAKAFCHALNEAAGTAGAAATVIRGYYADCPAAECSWGVVDFDRVYADGEERRVVPMRATALVRHGDDGFRLIAWQAAPRPGGKGKKARAGG